MFKSASYLVVSAFSLLAFVIATNGFDVVARILVAEQPLMMALKESLYYAAVQPVGTLMLAAPFAAIGGLTLWVWRSSGFRGAMLFFVVFSAALYWLYFSGYWYAQEALLEKKWTASALSVGLLPFKSILVVAIGVAVTGFIAWKH